MVIAMKMNFNKIGETQISTLFDRGYVSYFSGSLTSSGDIEATFSGSTVISCGVKNGSTNKIIKNDNTITIFEKQTTIRIPIDTTVCEDDLFVVTEKSGSVVNITFQIDGIAVGTGIKILACKAIEA